MKDNELKDLIVKKLNRDLEKTVKTAGVPDNNPRKLRVRIGWLKGLILNEDKLLTEVDMDTDFRIEVEDIFASNGYVTVTYRFEHMLYP